MQPRAKNSPGLGTEKLAQKGAVLYRLPEISQSLFLVADALPKLAMHENVSGNYLSLRRRPLPSKLKESIGKPLHTLCQRQIPLNRLAICNGW